jgi:uncharacterized protein (TIGR03435 family)
MYRLITLLAAMIVCAPSGRAQQTTPAFDVISIKLNVSGATSTSYRPSPGRYSAMNVPIGTLIAYAYEIHPILAQFLLVGGRGEVLGARVDIDARSAVTMTRAETLQMLRAVLADRFRLRIHKETRRVPVFALTVASPGRLGPQLRVSEHDCVAFAQARQENPDLPLPRDRNGRLLCANNAVAFNTPMKGATTIRDAGTMRALLARLQPHLDRPVIDATGLSGSYEWEYAFAMTDTIDVPVPSLVTAVREQLGLKLEPRVGLEVFVIDSVDLPTPN